MGNRTSAETFCCSRPPVQCHRDLSLHKGTLLAEPPPTIAGPLKQPSHILDGIWIGGTHQTNTEEFFLAQHITHVVSLGPQVPGFPGFSEACESIHASDVADNEDGASVLFSNHRLFDILGFIRDARRCPETNVLVHCQEGISRSPTVVIAYLVVYLHFSVDEALHFVKQRRCWAHPNEHFIEKLYTL